MAKTLEMVYGSNLNKEVTYSLSNPKDGLTDAEVKTFMNSCITKNIFNSATNGDLTLAKKAFVREVTETALAKS